LLTPKYTGIAVFVAPVVAPYVRLLGVYKHSFGASEGSKGGAAVALGMYDVTCAFVSTHQASKKPDMRRKQFQELVDRLGGKLGCRGFGLTDEFHHCVWMGDLNTHCRGVSAADAMELIGSGRHLQLLLQHDELLIEKEAGTVFHEFEEPLMAPSFFPTYKRHPGRGPMGDILSQPDWHQRMFITQYKEPLYKGGRVMERIPSWTDRIQYHSLPDRWGELLPESLDPSRPSASPHNYHVVNDSLDSSDHAPVFCTFSLQISAEELGDAPGLQSALDAYVVNQQQALGYRQADGEEDVGYGSQTGATIVDGGVPPDSLAAVALPPSSIPGVMSDADFSALHPSLRPLVVVLRVAGVVVDCGGVGVVPRAMSVIFPLPYEDSDLIPERHKVVRADPSNILGHGRVASAISSGMRTLLGGRFDPGASLTAGIRTVVSRASRLESLHLLLRVTLDDHTKCQCVIAMRDGGFVGAGSHMNTFKQPLTSNGVVILGPNGAPLALQFTLEMHAYQRGGTQGGAPPPGSSSLGPTPNSALSLRSTSAATAGQPPKTPGGGAPPNFAGVSRTPFPSSTFRSSLAPSLLPPPSASAPAPTPMHPPPSSSAAYRSLAASSSSSSSMQPAPGVDAEAARIKALKIMAAARAKAASAASSSSSQSLS